ncbi:MAG: NUDIX hydrolase [Elusimicrobiota bacterium]|nr:NUDIX hydrolase [Elusimicrobiota bacterium]
MKDASLVERFVRTRKVWGGNAVDFRVDTVRLPNGKLATREFMDHPGAVGVVPFLDARTVVMVRQYRHPVREVTLELPAGKLDKGERPLPCVRRELAEETGYTARRIKPLIQYWPTAAFANEVLHLYVAEGLRPGRAHADADEFIECVTLPFKKAVELVRRGEIRDSKTVIGLLACAVYKRLY